MLERANTYFFAFALHKLKLVFVFLSLSFWPAFLGDPRELAQQFTFYNCSFSKNGYVYICTHTHKHIQGRDGTIYFWFCCVWEHTFLNNMERLSKFGCWLRSPGIWTLVLLFWNVLLLPHQHYPPIFFSKVNWSLSFFTSIPLGGLELNTVQESSLYTWFLHTLCFGTKKR